MTDNHRRKQGVAEYLLPLALKENQIPDHKNEKDCHAYGDRLGKVRIKYRIRYSGEYPWVNHEERKNRPVLQESEDSQKESD